MKTKHKLGSSLLATVTLAGVLFGSVATASADASDKSTFSMFYNLNDKKSFDPDVFSYEMYLDGIGIFEGLVRMGANGKIVPGIARSWSTSNNGLVWTFKLRDAKFSNGDPVTAEDFVYSIKRAMDARTAAKAQGSPVPVSFLPLKNAQAIRAGNLPFNAIGAKAIDANTLQLTLQYPDANFLRDLTLPANAWMVPLDEHVVTQMKPGDWDNPSKIVSDGPYMVQSYAVGTSVTLVPNPYYYGKVHLKKITLSFTSADTLVPYQNGVLDMVQLQPTDIAAVEANPALKKDLHWWPATEQYSFEVVNSANPLLRNNENIRKAFEMAIDKNAIANDVLKGAGTPAYEYFSPSWLDPWIKKVGIGYNPKEAQALMAKAGFKGGKGFPTVVLFTAGTDPVAQAVQQMWEQTLGVKVDLRSEEWGQFVTDFQKQLPANEVGFYVWSTNATYQNLMLPQSVNQWLGLNTSAIRGYASPSGYQQWIQITNNKGMDPASQILAQENALWKSFPADVQQYLNLGIKAFQTGDPKLAQQFFTERAERAYDIPVYTPLTPVLLRSDVKGYTPNFFIDVNPPYWLNDITR